MNQADGRFGRYEVGELIGEGAMARVYKAWDPRTDRHVALKVLKEAWRSDADLVARFLREARAAGALNHPNIVGIFDVADDGPAPYIVMELVEGPSLAQRLQLEGALPPAEAARLVAQVARALDFAHARGRVHRDIKPSNILLTESGAVRLGDFGIARIEDSEATRMQQGADALGTPRYMAPEQVENLEIDGRADLFALGATFYEMLTGMRAFDANNALALATQIRSGEPRPLREVAPAVSPAMAAVVERLLRKDPEERFQSGNDLAAAIEQALSATAEPPRPAATRPPSRQEAPAAARPEDGKGGRSRMPLLAGIVVLIGAGALAALWFWPQPPLPVPVPVAGDTGTDAAGPAGPDTSPGTSPGLAAPTDEPPAGLPERIAATDALKPADEGDIAEAPATPAPDVARPVDDAAAPFAAGPALTEDSRAPAGEQALPTLPVLSAPAEEPAPVIQPGLPVLTAPGAALSSKEREAARELLDMAHGMPCTRLEVEPSSPDLAFTGSTADPADRDRLMEAAGAIAARGRTMIDLKAAPLPFCRAYDLLAAATDQAVPRLADLRPPRASYRLVRGDALIVEVTAPDFPAHVRVDYFMADGSVAHLWPPGSAERALEPGGRLTIGNPLEGQEFRIDEPFGAELIIVLATPGPLFETVRPKVEPAGDYLDALDAALRVAGSGPRPVASTIAVETAP